MKFYISFEDAKLCKPYIRSRYDTNIDFLFFSFRQLKRTRFIDSACFLMHILDIISLMITYQRALVSCMR